MAACTQCGAKIPDPVRFCTQCGADQRASFNEAVTFVPTPDVPHPGRTGAAATVTEPTGTSATDTATNPVLSPFDTRPVDAAAGFETNPSLETQPTLEKPVAHRPPPAREYIPPPPAPLPPSTLPIPSVSAWPPPAEPLSPVAPAAPAPAVAPLPPVAAPIAAPPNTAAAAASARAAKAPVIFPPASARPAMSQTTRNVLLMGVFVWVLVGIVSGSYLAFMQFGGGPDPASAFGSPAAEPAAPGPAPSAPAATTPSEPAATATASAGGTVFTGHTAAVTSLAVSDDQQYVISGGGQGDCSVRVWDLSRSSQSGRFDGHGQDCSVLVLALTGGARVAASAAGSTDFALRVWDPKSGGEMRQLSGGEALIYRAIAADGTRAVGQEIGGPDGGGGFSLWDLESGSRLTTVSARGLAAAFAFAPGGDRVLTGGDNGQIAIWDAGTGAQQKVFPGHAGVAVAAVAFAPNRRLLITLGADGRVSLWDPETGAVFRTVDAGTSFAMADDSRTLAIGGSDGVVRVIDAITGVEHARLTGHSGPVQALAWLPGGRALVSGGADKSVRVWAIASRS